MSARLSRAQSFFAGLILLPAALMLQTSVADAGEAPASASSGHYRVVFELTQHDEHLWNHAFGNFRNIQADLGAENLDIELVVHGAAIAMLEFDSAVGNRVAEALNSGVKVVACRNSMKSKQLTEDDMLPDIGYVPAGIPELIKRQEEGWSYIRF